MSRDPIPCTGPRGCRHQHRHYFLTCAEYAELMGRAGSRCEICRIPGSETSHGFLMIDHDPRYDYVRAEVVTRDEVGVRGLLCCPCNSRLTVSPESLPAESLAKYLADPWHLTTPLRDQRDARLRARRARLDAKRALRGEYLDIVRTTGLTREHIRKITEPKDATDA